MVAWSGLVPLLLALLLPPLLLGIINRTKAVFAGRRGAPLWQPYRELGKLLRKSAVYSQTTTPVFLGGPVLGLAAVGSSLLFVPLGGLPALVSFPGDFLLVAYLLGLVRFLTVLGALDTGSSFEGMGASREVFFSALAEPAFLLALTSLAVLTRRFSLSEIVAGLGVDRLASAGGPSPLLAAGALMVVFLAENSRMPVDDPNTHLELTMIHEVMILDHGGPDLALIEYGAALKLWVLGSVLVGIFHPPWVGWTGAALAGGLGGMVLLAVGTGVVESVMARLRLLRVPQFLVGALVLAMVALVLVVR